jgi:hypothetical protein
MLESMQLATQDISEKFIKHTGWQYLNQKP